MCLIAVVVDVLNNIATETALPPSVLGADAPKAVSFSSSDAPIQAVTVFCKGKAEVTRVINFSSPSSLGRHEVCQRYSSLGNPTQFVVVEDEDGHGSCVLRFLVFYRIHYYVEIR
ncbi:unnamed protein product [Ectocarpus sp. CCAP 1310/34]|nr:unnamed protein product [Ectocarpus sp. CCAP 1310/34]